MRIFIFTALYQEAAPLIRQLHLKKKEIIRKTDVFTDGETLFLALTGSGELNAAVIAAAVLSRLEASQEDALIVYGSAASLKEEIGEGLYQAAKLTDANSGRSYYPDLLYRTGLTETAFLCGSTVYRKGSRTEDEYGLYDMESAAVFHAGKMYLPPHRMFFFRFVSDDGETEKVNAALLESLSERYAGPVVSFIEQLRESETQKKPVLSEEDEKQIDELAEQLRCSASMKHTLHGYIYYAKLTGLSLKDLRAGLKLPAENREEGKKILYEIRQFIIQ